MGLGIIVLIGFFLFMYLFHRYCTISMWRGDKEYYESTGKLRSAAGPGLFTNCFNPDDPENINGYSDYSDIGPKTIEAIDRDLKLGQYYTLENGRYVPRAKDTKKPDDTSGDFGREKSSVPLIDSEKYNWANWMNADEEEEYFRRLKAGENEDKVIDEIWQRFKQTEEYREMYPHHHDYRKEHELKKRSRENGQRTCGKCGKVLYLAKDPPDTKIYCPICREVIT